MRGRENPFIAHLMDQLAGFGPVAARAMFGGHGLYLHGVMFGLVLQDTLYLKTDAANRSTYEDAGMRPVVYESQGRTITMSYHQAPPEALEDGEMLTQLAREAHAAAQRAKAAGPRRGRGRRYA